ncbi:hypothetical protein GCM10027348_31990 [Hymenobacter tenuis]
MALAHPERRGHGQVHPARLMHCPIPEAARPFATGLLLFVAVLALTVYIILHSEPPRRSKRP